MKVKLMKKAESQSLRNSGKDLVKQSSQQEDLNTHLFSSLSLNGNLSLRVLADAPLSNTKHATLSASSSEEQQKLSSIAREGLYCLRISERLQELKMMLY